MVIRKLTVSLNKFRTLSQAKGIHAQILVNHLNYLEPILVRQILLLTRSEFRSIAQYVQQILLNSRNPDDKYSWACGIRFYSQHGQFKKAFSLYASMHRLRITPSTYAVSSAMKACARMVYKTGGTLIHGHVEKYGCCSVYVETALLDFYAKVGDMLSARKLFDEMTERNVVSWNSILSGYLNSGDLNEGSNFFKAMQLKDVVSWNSMVSGYARAGKMEMACCLFREMPERSSASWNALISGYMNCGNVQLARKYFNEMPQKNSVSWITMISGYSKCGDVESALDLFNQMGDKERDLLAFNAIIACFAQNGKPKEAIDLFNKMFEANISTIQPDKMTFSSALSACSQLGDLGLGSWIESYMNELGVEMDDHITTALIDLHAKSGSIDKAYELFLGLKKKDVIAYTAMILGCGINGRTDEAIGLFEKMLDSGVFPNEVTFTGMLTAYNHAGLVEEGYQCFKSMREKGLVLTADHFGIVVDLLGRAGRLNEALELINSMPMKPNSGAWGALLLASRLHNNIEIGEIAAKNCFEQEADATGYASSLANIYASVGRWDDAKRLRKTVKEMEVTKVPGCSWIKSS